MFVFFEGVDGSGKSTLVGKVLEMLTACDVPAGYLNFEDVINDPQGEYNQLVEYQTTRKIWLVDRCFITDIVYRIVDEKPRMGIDLYQALRFLNGSKIVYCKTKTSYKDALRRGDDNIPDLKTHNKRCQTYDTIISLIRMFTGAKVYTFDWRTDYLPMLVKQIKE